jgi:hypothetical protein
MPDPDTCFSFSREQTEVERLTAALRQIADHPNTGDANDDHRMRAIAQAALEGE